MSMFHAALRYAEFGFPVFPCHWPLFANGETCSCERWRRSARCRDIRPDLFLKPGETCASPGKHPLHRRWQNESSADMEEVQRLWSKAPSANIALDCGKAGLLVLDLDVYKDSYAAPRFRLNEETVTVLTGNGGTHLWYRQPDDVQFGSSRGTELPDGVDIRGLGNLVIVPPSLHRTGRRYQFENGYSPAEMKIAPLPDVLREILERAQGTQQRRPGAPGVSDVRAVQQAQKIVERVLRAGGFEYSTSHTWNDGVVYVLAECPFNPYNDRGEPHPADRAAYVTINANGAIACGCHHERCRQTIARAGISGWSLLRQIVARHSVDRLVDSGGQPVGRFGYGIR